MEQLPRTPERSEGGPQGERVSASNLSGHFRTAYGVSPRFPSGIIRDFLNSRCSFWSHQVLPKLALLVLVAHHLWKLEKECLGWNDYGPRGLAKQFAST